MGLELGWTSSRWMLVLHIPNGCRIMLCQTRGEKGLSCPCIFPLLGRSCCSLSIFLLLTWLLHILSPSLTINDIILQHRPKLVELNFVSSQIKRQVLRGCLDSVIFHSEDNGPCNTCISTCSRVFRQGEPVALILWRLVGLVN